jgi:hypothetical protein
VTLIVYIKRTIKETESRRARVGAGVVAILLAASGTIGSAAGATGTTLSGTGTERRVASNAGAVPGNGREAADPIILGRPRVQLFYEYSGRLSPDIAPPARFDLWNVGAGEGSAAEPASDALVTVPLTMRPAEEAKFTTRPLTITATGPGGKRIAARTFPAGMLLVPYRGGPVWARLWLQNIPCAGRMRIEARYGTKVTAAALNFACGE